ncbi:MAG: amidohydrolase family protein, partial [Deltaproteobacteria bacterium]|nr:amidohydrolase family protein [Deltaproteobacteria bacterium]
DILAQNDTKVVHIPESNMKLSSGTARVSDMLKKGLTIGIGTDCCASNNNLDIFQEMDTAAKLGKITTMDPTATNAETVLRMATLWGAKVMRLDKVTGSIEKGKKADIIVIDMNSPHLVPLYNPVSQIVYSAKGSDVRDVIVNGRILMRDRKFLSLDLEGIMSKTRDIGRRIGSRG